MISRIARNTFLGKPNLTVLHLERNAIRSLDMASLMVSVDPARDQPKMYLAGNPLLCDCRLGWLPGLATNTILFCWLFVKINH